MTNEQLATFIHSGGNDELIPILWEKVQRFVYMKAEQAYSNNTASCKRHGVELWDIKQAGYIAFLEALKGYKPETGYKFITFIQYPFKNAINELLKLRTNKERNEPLNNSISLDTPATDKDGDADTAIIDLQADENSLSFITEIEAAELSETIRAEIKNTLTEKQAEIITRFYLQGQSLQHIAKDMNVSAERIRQHKVKAENELRKNTTLRKIYNDFYKTEHYFY